MIRHRNAKWHYTTTTIAVILSYIVLHCSLSGVAFHPASTSSWRPIQTAFVSSKLESCKYIKMHCSTNKGIDYLDEEDEEDDENELTDDEKKSLAKAYFDNTLNLNENSVRPTDVYIILFNPNTSSEGAHTVKFCGKDYMLGFESRPECISFSNQLEESGFYQPVPKEINLDSLEEYCKDIGVEVQVVPTGSDIKPPSKKMLNLGLNPDLDKEMKFLDYLYQVSETEETGHSDEDSLGAWE